jgi:outer membrane lipoprotein carrier protein
MTQLKWLMSVIFIFTSLAAFAQNSQAQLNDLLSHFQSMSAHFTQQSITKKGSPKNSSGTMALQRPGKFRWEITQPNHQVIIADGKYLWIYDVDLEQATRQVLTKDTNSPAVLLSGSSDAIEQRFVIDNFMQEGSQLFFKLKPKGKQDMLQWVELTFVDKKLNQMAVVDHLEQRNVFQFTQVEINPPLAKKLFQFHAPRGVDIIQN